ncbi:protein AAL-toxin resistant 7 [Nicotiana tabacum]|uniref:Protein AAL-toxin resistant 7 n=1 Tax=Nicotiana tabacum TaxID=4097 RepID=A0A1S4C364_TOBAC
MRGRSSPKKGNSAGIMEVEKVDKLRQEPHLSGAYIRNLVKQLTSSRTKDPLNPKDNDENSTKNDDSLFSDTQQLSQPTPPPQPPQLKKKQVRRRLHTSRPYQERLLNMAEARREIVTALKFHRAAMKQQQQQQQSQTGPQSLVTWPQESSGEEQGKLKSRRNPRIYASNTINNNIPSYNNMENFSNSTFPNCLPQYPYSCHVSSFGSQLPLQDHLNFPLPNQTLGLNLNFHDFNNLDATPYCSSNNNTSVYSSASPSSSSDEFHYVGLSQEGAPIQMVNSINCEDSGLHPSMDDQEMAEIRSIGEQHEMEWNDTLNLATSAWWYKFLKTMEIDPDDESNVAEDYGCYPFDEVMEFPAWLNPNESCLQQQVDETYSDPTLPCMDIEEIEGMDAEWLA